MPLYLSHSYAVHVLCSLIALEPALPDSVATGLLLALTSMIAMLFSSKVWRAIYDKAMIRLSDAAFRPTGRAPTVQSRAALTPGPRTSCATATAVVRAPGQDGLLAVPPASREPPPAAVAPALHADRRRHRPLYRTYSAGSKRDDGRPEWGDCAVWEVLHHKDPYPFWLD